MIKFKIILILVIAGFSLLACNSSESVTVGTNPQIVKVTLKTKWNLWAANPYSVEAEVNDPQGIANIESVILQVKNASGDTLLSDSLFDDGAVYHPLAGDVIAGDGVFRNRFMPNQIDSVEGLYTFIFQAKDKEENLTQKYSVDVIFGFNTAPEIIMVTMTDTLKSGVDAEYIYTTVTDSDGVYEIESVYFDIFKDSNKLTIDPLTMINVEDSVFFYKMDSTFAACKKGWHDLVFIAEDEFEDKSDSKSESIYLENESGSILKTEVPDSVGRPSVIPTYAWVTDPQGLADVDSVYFTLQASDDTFVKDVFGIIVKMQLFDDGNVGYHGDEQANDGIYSEILQVTEANVADTYRFHFYMRDKVGQLSGVKIDTIKIY